MTAELTVQARQLAAALSLVGKAVPSRSTMPILQHVLVRTDGSELVLSGTDMEVGITTRIEAMITSEGELTVPARKLSDFVATLPAEGIVQLHDTGKRLTVGCDTITARLPIMNADEFPEIVNRLDGEIDVDGDAMLAALRKVVFCASTDDSHPVLTGVLLAFDGTNLTVASADGFRLSRTVIQKVVTGEARTVIVPARALGLVTQVLHPELFRIGFKRYGEGPITAIVFDDTDTTIESQLIDGNFPDVERIVPQSHKTRVTAARFILEAAIKRALIFARDVNDLMTLRIDKDVIVVAAESAMSGGGATEVPATVEGPGLEIAFNGRFLYEAVKAVSTANVVMGFNQPTNPCSITEGEAGDPHFVHVLMPMHIGKR